MHTNENNAIRYLMKEMDPSEEMEFEKKMREDENLLIEVESLRATNRKLSSLPLKTPPTDLTNSIIENASETHSKKVLGSVTVSFLLKRAIAASILLAVFTGGYFFYFDSAESTTEPALHPENIEPWVDRNEVLRFSDEQQSQSPAIETELSKSFEKLQLVNDPSGSSSSGNGILLTGSSN